MALAVRPVGAEDLDAFRAALHTTFAHEPDPAFEEADAARFRSWFEIERAHCVIEGDALVGTLGTFSLPMTIPGAHPVSVAGTTMVTVLPTHRRRGALRMLMSAHFAEVRERGEPLAALFASDSAIYGRFGYGLATVWAETTVDRRHVDRHRLVERPASVKLVSPELLRPLAKRVMDRLLPDRPGMFARSELFWDRRFEDRPSGRDGATRLRGVLVEEAGEPTGYALYRVKAGTWSESHGDAVVRVNEVLATTPGAAVGLWSFLLEHDLVKSIELFGLPEDDPVFAMLAGFRRARPRVTDQMFIRVMDVASALEARSYQTDGRLVLGVGDEDGFAAGTYLLEVDGGRAVCRPTIDDPDIGLSVEDLGSAYLGRSRLRQLSTVGRVTGRPETVAGADTLFGWPVAPWCQDIF